MKKLITGTILMLLISTALFAQNTSMEQDNRVHAGNILTYTNLEDAQLNAETYPTVLFFFASWCPSCRSAMKNIESNKSKLEDITIIIVNYDKYSDLKRKYGVTYQHTYVQIDSQGNKVTLWNGGDIDSILQNVELKSM